MSDAMREKNQNLAWDTSDMLTQVCDIATASAGGDHVVLGFGTRAMDEVQVRAFGARLVRRIALRPASAKHLRDMLARAVTESGSAHG